ncbi:MAG: hypothetical protein AAFV96_16055 [Pseudomonadota bacterium]
MAETLHTTLPVPDPEAMARLLAALGFRRRMEGARLSLGAHEVDLVPGTWSGGNAQVFSLLCLGPSSAWVDLLREAGAEIVDQSESRILARVPAGPTVEVRCYDP